MESSQRLAIFENLFLKYCILDMSQLKFSLKILNNISIGGPRLLGPPLGYALDRLRGGRSNH